jgi:hypothetical protein
VRVGQPPRLDAANMLGMKTVNRSWRWRFITLAIAAALPLLGILILLNLEVDARNLWLENHRSFALASDIADTPALRHNDSSHHGHDASSGTVAFARNKPRAFAKNASGWLLNATSELKQASSVDHVIITVTTSLQISTLPPASLIAGLPRNLPANHPTSMCAPLPMPSVIMPQYVRYKETAYQISSIRDEPGVFWETPKDVIGGDQYKCEGDMPFSMIESTWKKEAAESLRTLPSQVIASAEGNVRQGYKVGHVFSLIV